MKIICIGRNYSLHIQELGHTASAVPVFFMKPDSSIITRNRPFFIPDFSADVQYECEIIVLINRLGKCIQEKYAHLYYEEISLGVDFTARDLQREAIQKGDPWELCKAFDGSAIVGQFVDKNRYADVQNLHFSMLRNDQLVQQGNSADMLFGINKIIAYVSQFVTLKIGDILFTGTPPGVGKVFINDRLQGFLEDEKVFDFRVK